MKRLVTLNIHNYPIPVEINYSNIKTKRFYLAYGMICARMRETDSLLSLQERLERIFKVNTIEKINRTPLHVSDFVYVLGNIEKCSYSKKGTFSYSTCYINYLGKKINLKDFFLNYLTKRMEELEKMMSLPHHNIRIKDMYSCYGLNYVNRKEIVIGQKLVHFSKEIIDSVLIHELCHDFYQNHSKEFYNIYSKYCPNFRILQKKLTYGEIR